jgi:hypothetical protein
MIIRVRTLAIGGVSREGKRAPTRRPNQAAAIIVTAPTPTTPAIAAEAAYEAYGAT